MASFRIFQRGSLLFSQQTVPEDCVVEKVTDWSLRV